MLLFKKKKGRQKLSSMALQLIGMIHLSRANLEGEDFGRVFWLLESLKKKKKNLSLCPRKRMS